MAMYIATTVLLTVGLACGNERRDASDDYYCTSTDRVTCFKNISVLTQQRYCKFISGNTTTHYTCPDHIICDGGRWFRAEKCGENIKMKNINKSEVLSFGNSFLPKYQGKYLCLKNERNGCQNSSSNTLPVVVKLKGVDTYLGTFKCRGCRKIKISERMSCIEKGVNSILCFNLTDECRFVLQHVTTTTQSGRNVEGYFYLANSLHINKSDQEIRFNGSRGRPQIALSNRKFQPVSFCPPKSFNDSSAGTLTFYKTNIGRDASSMEVCADGTPRASMKCQGNFIIPSIWAALEVTNCTAEDDNNNPMIPMITTESVNLATKSDHELTIVPSTNLPGDTKRVTTVNTAESTTAFKEYINDNVPVKKENVKFVSRMLSENTKHPQNFDVVQLMWVSERLKNISEIGSSSPEVTCHVIETVDNLFNVKEEVFEESLPGGTPTMILRALETQLTYLHKEVTNFTYVKSSLGVAARQLERPTFGDNITFGGLSSIGLEDSTERKGNVSVMTGGDKTLSEFLATITLPANLLDEIPIGHKDRIPVTFIVHRTSLLFMSSNSRRRRHSERVESLVIAATVEGHNIANLSSPVISRFQIPHVDEPMAKRSRRCVFWDFTLANGFGDWSSEGCELASSPGDNTGSIIACHCNHLTNFAVLLDIQGDIDHIVLDILSIIGCMVSIFALVITLIVLLAVKKLQEQVPQKIIINLCFALLGLYIFFLVGIDKSSLEVGCVIFGAFIHYFCLASVAWMCVVATNMYLLFVCVFNVDVTGFMWKAYLSAWGLPMIVVVVSVILNHQNYANDYCFPQTGTPTFYLGVLLLVGLMLCYNFVIFIHIIRQVFYNRIGSPSGQDKQTEMIERAQSIFIISILIGLTWLFGFLSIGGARFIFNLLFLIFNSLQGFFVFFFFILRPKHVRMILFKSCYRRQDGNTGSYTLNKSKTDGTYEQKDTLDTDDVVVTNSRSA